MPASKLGVATRALVSVLLALARSYDLALRVNRDSTHGELLKAYRRLLLKAHPDKGGKKADLQKLQEAKEAWEKARTGTSTAGRPQREAQGTAVVQKRSPEYRVQSAAVLFTYQGVENLEQWHRFVAFVQQSLKKWSVWRWAATLEACETGGLHTHLVLQFRQAADRTTKGFSFEGKLPNASANDYCGEGVRKGQKYQESVNRGFFYVWADKEGTQREADGQPCREGNHTPVWTAATKGHSRYQVLGKWCQKLWQERKLSHETYEEYLYLCRDSVLSRKRNLDSVKEWENRRAEQEERATATTRVRSRLFQPFAEVPAATKWLALFAEELDRYPFLVVLAPSRAGKTEWAKSLFKKPLLLQVGDLQHFPDGLRRFNRKVHDGIVLDDLRDFSFLVRHQEKLQGKVDAEVEFASTPSGGYAYHCWLWRVPLVVTANYTTANRQLLQDNDFLGNESNRVLVELATPPASEGLFS